MTALKGWTASARTFEVRTPVHPYTVEVRATVSIYREVLRPPPYGKKRPVKSSEPVLQGVTMSLDAWETLKAVLEAAGCTTDAQPRER